MRDRCPAGEKDGVQIGLHNLMPLGGAHIRQKADVGYTSVIDQKVNVTKGVDGTGDHSFSVFFPGNIPEISFNPGELFQCAGGFLQSVPVMAAVDDEMVALSGQPDGGGKADPPGSAGDDCCFHDHVSFPDGSLFF